MITVEDKVLSSIKKKGSNLVIKLVSPKSCGWAGGVIKDLWIEVVKNFKDASNNYNAYEFNGINIYIQKSLRVCDEIYIYQKYNIPILGPIYDVKGIKI